MVGKDKRQARFEDMLQKYEIIKVEILTPCKKCGKKAFVTFDMKDINARGVYCGECGTWLKFEKKSGEKKIFKENKKKN